MLYFSDTQLGTDTSSSSSVSIRQNVPPCAIFGTGHNRDSPSPPLPPLPPLPDEAEGVQLNVTSLPDQYRVAAGSVYRGGVQTSDNSTPLASPVSQSSPLPTYAGHSSSSSTSGNNLKRSRESDPSCEISV